MFFRMLSRLRRSCLLLSRRIVTEKTSSERGVAMAEVAFYSGAIVLMLVSAGTVVPQFTDTDRISINSYRAVASEFRVDQINGDGTKSFMGILQLTAERNRIKNEFVEAGLPGTTCIHYFINGGLIQPDPSLGCTVIAAECFSIATNARPNELAGCVEKYNSGAIFQGAYLLNKSRDPGAAVGIPNGI